MYTEFYGQRFQFLIVGNKQKAMYQQQDLSLKAI